MEPDRDSPALIAYGTSNRTVGAFPDLILLNMFAETTPTNLEKGFALLGRPGCDLFSDDLPSPLIRGFYQQAGVYNGDMFYVSGTSVCRMASSGAITTLSGSVPGTGRVRMAGTNIAGDNAVRIVNGTGSYLISDGATVTAESLPDSIGFNDIAVLRSHWVAIRTDSQQAYFLPPGSSSWAALDTVAAEKEPDALVGLAVLGESVIPFGTEVTEEWRLTGDATILAPVTGSSFNVGCKARDSIVNVGQSLIFVGDDNIVYQYGTYPVPISDHALSEQIAGVQASAIRAWTFVLQGHEFYVLRLGDSATYVFDTVTKLWGRWASKGVDYWALHMGGNASGRMLAVDSRTGYVYRLSADLYSDDGDEIIRRLSAFVPVKERNPDCNSIYLECSKGQGLQEGQGSDPLASVRWSDDDGKTWSSWREVGLGAAGDYTTPVIAHRCGTMQRPGRYIQWQCSDPIDWRVSAVGINDES